MTIIYRHFYIKKEDKGSHLPFGGLTLATDLVKEKRIEGYLDSGIFRYAYSTCSMYDVYSKEAGIYFTNKRMKESPTELYIGNLRYIFDINVTETILTHIYSNPASTELTRKIIHNYFSNLK
jgi:hypothetical protein